MVGVTAGLAVLAGMVSLLATTGLPAVDSVTHHLIAIAVILMSCQLVAAVARRIGQPPVLGEMVGGLLLGPSLLGAVWPRQARFRSRLRWSKGLARRHNSASSCSSSCSAASCAPTGSNARGPSPRR